MEPLCDPNGDRKIKDLPAPPHRPLGEDLLYPPTGMNKVSLFDF